MFNLKRKISAFLLSCFIFSSATSLPVFAASKSNTVTKTNSVQVNLNNTATIQLLKENPSTGGKILPKAVIDGEGGSVEIVPTSTQVSYFINPSEPADAFIGTVSITDLTSGQSAGFSLIYDFHGSLKYPGLSGHEYRLSISGTAYLGKDPVAYVRPNANVVWTC